jgi:hypothetical protein
MAIRRVTAFEEEVRRNPDLILREASDFFMERGNILQALQNLARHLEEASIPYAVIGAIALARHGLARMTMDIDILLSPEGLERFKELYLGRGYVPAFPGAGKTFRAADSGVRIKAITAGEYPGDGKPKPVRFPNPAETSAEMGGIRVLPLERLVELKLASGLTAPHRRRDLADVQDLIRALRLPAAFAARLDTSVQPLFRELWQEAQVIDPLQER